MVGRSPGIAGPRSIAGQFSAHADARDDLKALLCDPSNMDVDRVAITRRNKLGQPGRDSHGTDSRSGARLTQREYRNRSKSLRRDRRRWNVKRVCRYVEASRGGSG